MRKDTREGNKGVKEYKNADERSDVTWRMKKKVRQEYDMMDKCKGWESTAEEGREGNKYIKGTKKRKKKMAVVAII